MATTHRNHTIFHCLAVLLCLALFSLETLAQKQPAYTALMRDTLAAGKTLTVKDAVFFNPALKSTIAHTKSINSIITLRLNEYTTKAFPDSFQAKVKLRAVYINQDNVKDSTKDEEYTVDYNKNKPYDGKKTF